MIFLSFLAEPFTTNHHNAYYAACTSLSLVTLTVEAALDLQVSAQALSTQVEITMDDDRYGDGVNVLPTAYQLKSLYMHLISGVFDPNNILIHVSQNFVNFAVSRMLKESCGS